jgi:hypothetical protein
MPRKLVDVTSMAGHDKADRDYKSLAASVIAGGALCAVSIGLSSIIGPILQWCDGVARRALKPVRETNGY